MSDEGYAKRKTEELAVKPAEQANSSGDLCPKAHWPSGAEGIWYRRRPVLVRSVLRGAVGTTGGLFWYEVACGGQLVPQGTVFRTNDCEWGLQKKKRSTNVDLLCYYVLANLSDHMSERTC